MPRYFFDLDDGVQLYEDDAGRLCDAEVDAQDLARTLLLDLMRRHLILIKAARTFTVWIRDESGDARLKMELTYNQASVHQDA